MSRSQIAHGVRGATISPHLTHVDISDPQFEKVEIEVLTDELCSMYGCDRCPGHVASVDGTPVFCDHDCHRVDSDA
jgi:hypothetical protein